MEENALAEIAVRLSDDVSRHSIELKVLIAFIRASS